MFNKVFEEIICPRCTHISSMQFQMSIYDLGYELDECSVCGGKFDLPSWWDEVLELVRNEIKGDLSLIGVITIYSDAHGNMYVGGKS